MSAGLATRADLKESLTLEEAYQAYEVLLVRQYHEWLANDNLKKEIANG